MKDLIMFVLLLIFSISYLGAQTTWVAPKEADKLTNAYKDNAKVTAKAETKYKAMCAICHGTKGKGDGPAGMSLNPRPGSFLKSTFQEQSDGAIYWKLTHGNPPMAAYEKILTEDERWGMVNYLRSLSKK